MEFDPARYQYVLTNPLKSNDKLKFLGHSLTNINKYNYRSNELMHKFSNFFYDFYNDILDEEAYVIFTVDGFTEVLTQIDLRYKGVEYKELFPYIIVKEFKKDDFHKRNKCSYFNNID